MYALRGNKAKNNFEKLPKFSILKYEKSQLNLLEKWISLLVTQKLMFNKLLGPKIVQRWPKLEILIRLSL